MRAIGRFEDLVAWRKAKPVARKSDQNLKRGSFLQDLGLPEQMPRAIVSTRANIAEGYGHPRQGKFHQFLSMIKPSYTAVRSPVFVGLDAGCLDLSDFSPKVRKSGELSVTCIYLWGSNAPRNLRVVGNL